MSSEENTESTTIESLTTCYMNQYEKTKTITMRAMQLYFGNDPLIDIDPDVPYDPITIAEKELELGLLNLVTRRVLPDGRIEDWNVSNLVIPE